MNRRVAVGTIAAIVVLGAGALFWRLSGQPSAQAPVTPTAAATPGERTDASCCRIRRGDHAAGRCAGVSVSVPAGWSYRVGATLSAYADDFPGSEPLLLLWRAGAEFEDAPVRASLVRMRRNELDVPSYLAGVRAELTAAGLTVEPPTLTSSLRDDGLPAGQLTFRRVMPDGTEQLGVQYVFVAGEGNDLIAISLAAAAGQVPRRCRRLVEPSAFTALRRHLLSGGLRRLGDSQGRCGTRSFAERTAIRKGEKPTCPPQSHQASRVAPSCSWARCSTPMSPTVSCRASGTRLAATAHASSSSPAPAADTAAAARMQAWFTAAEADTVEILDIPNRRAAAEPALLSQVENATGILITDGNPLRFTSLLGGTPLAQAIRRANARGRVVGGIGRGGAVLCQHMIAFDDRTSFTTPFQAGAHPVRAGTRHHQPVSPGLRR